MRDPSVLLTLHGRRELPIALAEWAQTHPDSEVALRLYLGMTFQQQAMCLERLGQLGPIQQQA
jgi:hypothetical protein